MRKSMELCQIYPKILTFFPQFETILPLKRLFMLPKLYKFAKKNWTWVWFRFRFQGTKQAFIAAVTVIFKDFINHPSIRCVGILLRLPDRLTYQYIDSASSRIEPEWKGRRLFQKHWFMATIPWEPSAGAILSLKCSQCMPCRHCHHSHPLLHCFG